MEDDQIKILKRQRTALLVIVAVQAFVTLLSMMYAYVQQGIATENAWLAQAKAIEAQKNAQEANKQVIAAKRAIEEANRQMKIAQMNAMEAQTQRRRADEALKLKSK